MKTTKQILAAVTGFLLMAGTMGVAAQTLEETIEWLEGKFGTIGPLWTSKGNKLHKCTASFYSDGDVRSSCHYDIYSHYNDDDFDYSRWFEYRFNIGDVVVWDDVDDGLRVRFGCEGETSCIKGYSGAESYSVEYETDYNEHGLSTATYSEDDVYTTRDLEFAAKLVRGLLHYQELVSAAGKDDLF